MKIIFFTMADNEVSSPDEPLPRRNQYRRFSQAEREFMRDNWQIMTTAEIAQALGRTKSSVATIGHRHLGLRKNEAAKYMANSKAQRARKDAYSEDELQYLRDHWQTMTIPEIARALGRTAGSVKSKAHAKGLGLRKTKEAIRTVSSGPNSGSFKKGNLPANTVYGDELVIRIRHNKLRGASTKYIRTGFRQWREYQHYLWEQAHGPVPKNMVLTFINGDTMDCRLENLKLITKAENALRNSGSINLPDSYVAHLMAVRKPELQEELLNHPDLIDLKRTELQLKRAIKSHDNPKPAKTRRPRKSNGQ